MTVEGVLAVVAGIAAGSIALIGFGLDSAIEGIASVIIIWRFWGARALSEEAERRAQKLVAVSFFLLAPYVAIESVRALVTGHEAATSYLGIGLTIVSAALMPVFGIAKKRVEAELGSAATAAEGTQNMLCAYLSLAVLGGYSATHSSGRGGSTRSRACSSPTWRCARAASRGKARSAPTRAGLRLLAGDPVLVAVEVAVLTVEQCCCA